MKSLFSSLLLSLLFFSVVMQRGFAQKIKKEDFFFVDSMAQKAGAMNGYSLQYIVDSLSKHCHNELQMTRAFYYWQSHFVAFDIRRHRKPKRMDNASTALMERKAASKGFAEMFQAMCQLAGIECEIVKGLIRYRISDLGHLDANEVAYWNILTINHTQYLVDISRAQGYFDEYGKGFKSSYTDAWWLCNRRLFALAHFPELSSKQLLESPITKLEWAKSPLIFPGAIVSGLMPTKTLKEVVRQREMDSTKLKFHFASGLNVTSVRYSFDQNPLIEIPFDFDEFGFYIQLPSANIGKHIAYLYFNGALSYVFKTEVSKNVTLKKKYQVLNFKVPN